MKSKEELYNEYIEGSTCVENIKYIDLRLQEILIINDKIMKQLIETKFNNIKLERYMLIDTYLSDPDSSISDITLRANQRLKNISNLLFKHYKDNNLKIVDVSKQASISLTTCRAIIDSKFTKMSVNKLLSLLKIWKIKDKDINLEGNNTKLKNILRIIYIEFISNDFGIKELSLILSLKNKEAQEIMNNRFMNLDILQLAKITKFCIKRIKSNND